MAVKRKKENGYLLEKEIKRNRKNKREKGLRNSNEGKRENGGLFVRKR